MGSAIMTAIAIGAAVAFQVSILSRSGAIAHPLAVSLALQASGLLVSCVWVVARRDWAGVLAVAGQWWWLPLGTLGWGVVAALGFAARLGVGATLAAVSVAAQLVIGLGIDLRTGTIPVAGDRPPARPC